VTSYIPHSGVDAYLAGLPEWQREICQQLRELAHAADPDDLVLPGRRHPRGHCSTSSDRSSPTTAPAAGAGSRL